MAYKQHNSSTVAISVRDVSKVYKIIHQDEKHTRIAEAVLHWMKNPFTRSEPDQFWALKNVDFDIYQGDTFGIIGHNGAGKSTLLKILSRIIRPTTGNVTIRGRVGSLLEVGTGFHPELTGRENIFLNGAIMGMTQREIVKCFDDIIGFVGPGVERHLDTPVKRYSSGMYVRLAFGVAAHLSADVLIVDEVLAVGDAEFQKKCLGKMQDVANGGRTVIFVSHNMAAVTRLCKSAVWMQRGGVVDIGPVHEVVEKYQNTALITSSEWIYSDNFPSSTSCKIVKILLANVQGNLSGIFDADEDIVFHIEYTVEEESDNLQIAARITNSNSTDVLASFDTDYLKVSMIKRKKGKYRTTFCIPKHTLAPGKYSTLFAVIHPEVQIHQNIENAIVFEVTYTNSAYALSSRWNAITAPLYEWNTVKIAENTEDLI